MTGEKEKTFKPGDTFKNKEGDVFVLADDGQTWIPLDMVKFQERKCKELCHDKR